MKSRVDSPIARLKETLSLRILLLDSCSANVGIQANNVRMAGSVLLEQLAAVCPTTMPAAI